MTDDPSCASRHGDEEKHVHTKLCWDDPGPSDGKPFLVCEFQMTDPSVSCPSCASLIARKVEDIMWESGVQGHPWPALIADPPYTEDDADHYAMGRVVFPSANKILRNMLDVVRVGGRVGMLHYVLPQPPRLGVRFVACIGVIVGYNNRMRVFSVFEREQAHGRPGHSGWRALGRRALGA